MKFRQLLSVLALSQDFEKPKKIVIHIFGMDKRDNGEHPYAHGIDIKMFNRPDIKSIGLDDKEVIECYLDELTNDMMLYVVKLEMPISFNIAEHNIK